MKTTRNLLRASAVAFSALICGCATTESRIEGNPRVFARLTPGQQALVRAGQVEPGFDMDAVRMALGEPDRVMVVTNAGGERQVWRYVTYGDQQPTLVFDGYYNAYSAYGAPASWVGPAYDGGFPGYHGYGNWGGPYIWAGSFLYDGAPARAHDRIRVIFDTTGHVAEVRRART
jgi:hypothetical protein